MRSRIFFIGIWTLALWFYGCGSDDVTLDRKLSGDDQFWTELRVTRTGPLDYDWKAVVIGKVHPKWTDILIRKTSEEICALHGPGELTVSWMDPRHVEVICTKCRTADFFPQSSTWEGVSIKFAFNGKPVPDTFIR